MIIFAGISSLISIPKESSPDIKFGIISISTLYSGVNPQDIDSLITEEIESEIKDIDGIKKITSSSSVWFSSITVELQNGVSTRNVMTDIKDKIDSIAFPENAEDPVVTEVSSDNEVVFQAVLHAKDVDNFTLIQKAKALQSKIRREGWESQI